MSIGMRQKMILQETYHTQSNNKKTAANTRLAQLRILW